MTNILATKAVLTARQSLLHRRAQIADTVFASLGGRSHTPYQRQSPPTAPEVRTAAEPDTAPFYSPLPTQGQ
jgi:hypothetical protein